MLRSSGPRFGRFARRLLLREVDMATLPQTVPAAPIARPKLYLPREHGATAMLLTPIFSVAILARTWHWTELAVLAAAFAAMSAKDPAVFVTRQQFVWKQLHPETPVAIAWLIGWSVILVSSSVVLLAAWPLKAFL